MTQDRWPANGDKGTCFAQVRTPTLSFASWFTLTYSGVAQSVKHLRAMRRPGFNLGSGRSSGEGNGYTLQYCCQEKSMDIGSQQATVYGVVKN